MSSSRSRFVSDDPDPSAADGPKFLPSFAQSPAGKVALVRTDPIPGRRAVVVVAC